MGIKAEIETSFVGGSRRCFERGAPYPRRCRGCGCERVDAPVTSSYAVVSRLQEHVLFPPL